MALSDRDIQREREAAALDREAAAREREAARRAPVSDRRYDEFGESMATPVPNRTYRSSVETVDDKSSLVEQVVRYVAVILGALLAIRFVINLFSGYRSSGFTNFIYATTNWMVRPFQALFGQPAASTGGFFDWPAIAAIVTVGIVAGILIALLRPRPY